MGRDVNVKIHRWLAASATALAAVTASAQPIAAPARLAGVREHPWGEM